VTGETKDPLTLPVIIHPPSESGSIDRKSRDHANVLQGDRHLSTRQVKRVCLRPPTVHKCDKSRVVDLRGVRLNWRTKGRRPALSKYGSYQTSYGMSSALCPLMRIGCSSCKKFNNGSSLPLYCNGLKREYVLTLPPALSQLSEHDVPCHTPTQARGSNEPIYDTKSKMSK
jgi:hypothetical protein